MAIQIDFEMYMEFGSMKMVVGVLNNNKKNPKKGHVNEHRKGCGFEWWLCKRMNWRAYPWKLMWGQIPEVLTWNSKQSGFFSIQWEVL